ncbi:MAG: hypothetical protein KAH01_00240 [Caldisericia bacterium]|nr:hypothetical protein [Caldisericia bacterium]
MKQITKNSWIVSVLTGFLFCGFLILPTQLTKAQPNAFSEMAPLDFQDIAWYGDKAIFATHTNSCGGHSNWMLAEKVNNAWQVVHVENIPNIIKTKYKVTLRSSRLRVFNGTLYLLATNKYHDLWPTEDINGEDITGSTSRIYRYNLKTLAYIDTISFPLKCLIHDFVVTNSEQIIVLTDEGLFTYQDNSLQILKEIDATYNELQWMDETNLCISGLHYRSKKDSIAILQYDLDTNELSTLYESKVPIFDIAVTKDQTIYAIVKNPETKNIQLYCYKDGIFSLYDHIQRLLPWARVLIGQDNQTPITINIFRWSNPILYLINGDSVIRQPMQFNKPTDRTLQYPTFLHATTGETSVLVNKGICIYEDVNPQDLSPQWEDTGLTIPYEECRDIIKIDEKAYLVLLTYTEFCIVDSDGYSFSESFYNEYSFRKIIPYNDEYYLCGFDHKNKHKWILQKVNLDDCTLDSSPVSGFPEGLNTVFEETIYVYKDEIIIKGIIEDNAFIEQEVLPVTDLYWDNFSCNKLFYNPVNETFILADLGSYNFRATFLEVTEKKEFLPIGFINYEQFIPHQGSTFISFLTLLNGHVSFIINEGYGRLVHY